MAPVQSWFKGILIDTDVKGFDGGALRSFFNNTQRDLIKISQTKLGADLLELIRKRHQGIGTSESGDRRTVTIKPRAGEGASTMATQAGLKSNVERMFGGRNIRFAGKGSRTFVCMHNDGNSEAIYTRLAGVPTPTYIALAHELIHALHHLGGNTYTDEVQAAGGAAKREEMFTTGLGAYKNTRISENALRREVGLRERVFYTFPDDHTHVTSLLQPLNALLPKGYWYCAALQRGEG